MTDHETTPKALEEDSSLLIFRIIQARLQASVAQEEEIDYCRVQASRRTFWISRISLAVVMVLSLPVFYLIWTLVDAMGTITVRMEQMKVQVATMRRDFDEVSQLIQTIEGAVANMRQNIAVIPPMEKRLFQMREDFDVMAVAMNRSITPHVVSIDQILAVMEANMAQMNQAFGFVNLDVFRMRKNVNTMSSPLRMMPFIGW